MVIPQGRSNKPHTIAFNSDGTLRYVELKIMNLRPPSESVQSNRWEQIGVWNSEAGHKVGSAASSIHQQIQQMESTASPLTPLL